MGYYSYLKDTATEYKEKYLNEKQYSEMYAWTTTEVGEEAGTLTRAKDAAMAYLSNLEAHQASRISMLQNDLQASTAGLNVAVSACRQEEAQKADWCRRAASGPPWWRAASCD